MRVLIGTLFAGENELDACVAAIDRQTHACDHFTLRELPIRAAHERLYGRFMERADDYDLFIKVDADMVIVSETLVADIVERFRASPGLQLLSIHVDDFFSGRLIDGLHTYRSGVRWSGLGHDLFVDLHPVRRDRRLRAWDLAPAALHCPDPAPFQCFHYGLHRGIKLVADRERRTPQGRRRLSHAINRQATWDRFRASGDLRLGWACLGFELALRGDLGVEHLDYGVPEPKRQFELYAGLEREELQRRLEAMRAADERRHGGTVEAAAAAEVAAG